MLKCSAPGVISTDERGQDMHQFKKIPAFTIQGFAMIEPLVALVVIGAGLLAIAKFQANLSEASTHSRQRAEALHLAQAKLEDMRYLSYGAIVSGSDTAPSLTVKNVNYARAWTVSSSNSPVFKTITVTVSWLDQKNQAQSVALTGIIGDHDSALSGTLISSVYAPGTTGLRTPFKRGITIPVPAIDNNDGTSSYIHPGGIGVVIKYRNTDGIVLSVTQNGQTTNFAPSSNQYTISGYVQETSTQITLENIDVVVSNINSGKAWNGSTMVNTAPASCWDDSIAYSNSPPVLASVTFNGSSNTVAWNNHGLANGTRVRFTGASLPNSVNPGTTYYVVDSQTNSFKLATSENGSSINFQNGSGNIHYAPAHDGYVTYTCLVSADWSGRIELSGFPIGTSGSTSRVCRYYATAENNSTAYAYPGITLNLSNQNYLVITGSTTCPTNTKQHQPI